VAPQVIFKLSIANAVYRLKMPALEAQDRVLINRCFAVGWRILDVIQTSLHKEKVRSITASIRMLAIVSLFENFSQILISVNIGADKLITIIALLELNIVEVRF